MTTPYTTRQPRQRILAQHMSDVQNGLQGLVYDITSRNYGAVADYSNATGLGTDCTDIINQCMSDLQDAGGGFCFAPPQIKAYLVKGTLVVPEGVWLVGRGGRSRNGYNGTTVPSATVFAHNPTTPSSHFLTLGTPILSYNYNVGLMNFSVFTRGGVTTGDAFHLEQASGLYAFNIRSFNGFGRGCYIKYVQDSVIEQSEFQGDGGSTFNTVAAFYLDGGTTNTTLTLRKCNLRQAQWGAVLASPSVGGNDFSLNLTLDNCVFETNAVGALDVYKGNDCELVNPYIENTPHAAGIYTGATSAIKCGVDGSTDVAYYQSRIKIAGGHAVGNGITNSIFLELDDCYYAEVMGTTILGYDKLLKTTANSKRIFFFVPYIDSGNTPFSLVNDLSKVVGIANGQPINSVHEYNSPAKFGAGQLEIYPNSTLARVVKAGFSKTGIADNSATGIFTITTKNEGATGSGGGYTCIVKAFVGHQITPTGGNVSGKYYEGQFTRTMVGSGGSTNTGQNTAVENNFTGASAANNAAQRDVNTVVMTVTETSEFVQTVNLTIDLTGADVTTAEVTMEVTLIWQGFTTPPYLTAV